MMDIKAPIRMRIALLLVVVPLLALLPLDGGSLVAPPRAAAAEQAAKLAKGCGQYSHAWIGTFSQDNRVYLGANIYPTGVVQRYTSVTFEIFNSAGALVAVRTTNPARDNCVVHHEPEAWNTSNLGIGVYTSFATYVRWETNTVVREPSTTFEVMPIPPCPDLNGNGICDYDEDPCEINPRYCNPCYGTYTNAARPEPCPLNEAQGDSTLRADAVLVSDNVRVNADGVLISDRVGTSEFPIRCKNLPRQPYECYQP